MKAENRLPPPTSKAEYALRVDCLCALYDASVTSGNRTKQRNAQVGGSALSKHQLSFGGWATDLVCDDVSKHGELEEAAEQLGLGAELDTDHVHVQGLPVGMRRLGFDAPALMRE